MLTFAAQSLWNRRFVAALTTIAIALSVALILGVERLRDGARMSFINSVSGIDLIIAPRGNDVQILMATVFGVGTTGSGMAWHSFEDIEKLDAVAWAVPLMMGDNHRGHPVIGTDAAYFKHFRHSGGAALPFAEGHAFEETFEAVVGADVAARFGYRVGTEIINAHGAGAVSFEMHDDAPFIISGVLAPTGTAVDRMVFVSLAGFDALHTPHLSKVPDPLARRNASDAAGSQAGGATLRWKQGDGAEDADHDAHGDHDDDRAANLHEPSQINGAFVGLRNRSAVLAVQRFVATYDADTLSAVMPNVALLQLWSITGTAENALRAMSIAVAAASMIGMLVMLSAALDSRRREFAILRSVGASPRQVFGLIVIEAMLVTVAGICVGLILLLGGTILADPILFERFGFRIGAVGFSISDATLLLAIFCFGTLASFLPAWRVYRITVADGLTARL